MYKKLKALGIYYIYTYIYIQLYGVVQKHFSFTKLSFKIASIQITKCIKGKYTKCVNMHIESNQLLNISYTRKYMLI